MKILPELLKSVEFGGGGPSVFGAIMKIGLKMSDDEFESRLAPLVIRLFSSPDRAMRVCLLDNLPIMVDRISQKDINGKIWPAMTSGFTDTAPVVREQTVKAVLAVISKLSDRVINGELLRYLAKTANDEQPGIRTNTTICLGKIARNLGVGSRAKVLIAAFSRALRDPFVHARNAALLALNATVDVFSEEDCATKVLPALCVSLIDKEKMVRDQATKCFETYLQRVRKYGLTMPDTVIPSEPPTGSTASAAPARIGNQSDSGWTGWAISSFTNKIASARGEIASAAPNGSTMASTQSLPNSGRATPTVNVSSERSMASTSRPARASTPQAAEDEVFQDDTLDAWGTVDDDGDNFFDAATATSKTSAATSAATPYDDGGEPDFAGWLAAQSAAKTQKKVLPKGMAKPSSSSGATLGVRPSGPARSISAGPTGTSSAGRNPVIASSRAVTASPAKAVKKEIPKPKQPEPSEDDWGDAWD